MTAIIERKWVSGIIIIEKHDLIRVLTRHIIIIAVMAKIERKWPKNYNEWGQVYCLHIYNYIYIYAYARTVL